MGADWYLDDRAYRRWLEGRETSLGGGIFLDRATVKNAICLALLENRNRFLSYQEINECFSRHRLFCDEPWGQGKQVPVPIATLRVAVSELNKKLMRSGHFLEIRCRKTGKTGKFALIDRENQRSRDQGLLHGPEEPLIDPRDIARGLVRDGGELPFASFYASYRAAAYWLQFSRVQSVGKRHYEANSFDAYELDKFFGFRNYGGELGFVSLATGEGLGEIALLNRLLRDYNRGRPRKVYYSAIDTSEFLLSCHSQVIRERFSEEIAEGRLVYAPLVGNLYQLEKCLVQLRMKFGDEFLRGIPILCTYFGNCIGNDENHEWDALRSITQSFDSERLAILVGISLLRCAENTKGRVMEENYTLSPFLLETPRHLMYDLGLLRSEDSRGRLIPLEENREFVEVGSAEPIRPIPYTTSRGIKGQVYRFYYTLQEKLLTWDGQQQLRRGNDVLLYSIVKYDLASFVSFLESRGFRVQAPPSTYFVHRIEEGQEEFRYAVVVAARGVEWS